MAHNEQLDKIINEDGFIAALDQSGGSTPQSTLTI
jgi:fructose-bisphosphate aldolase class 1